MAVSFFVAILFCFGNVFAISDYCSKNTYETNGTHMQFSKEATYEEFALTGKFKELHCCAKGYRTIEWHKDGKLYPWSLDLSGLILFPESANQTIYTQKITEDDAGNYTCFLSNDTVIHSHTIRLEVFDKLPDHPKITYVSKDQEVAVGEKLRLFCEAFAGRVELPDASEESGAEWHKVAPNGTKLAVPGHFRQEKNCREDGQTFGTYLIFPNVKKGDFGTYVCIIKKPGNEIMRHVSVRERVKVIEYIDPNPVPVGKLILFMTAILFVLLAAFILYLQYGLKMQVRLKDSFSGLEQNDGKSNDVLIVYSPKDSELALGVLLTTLQNRYQYKCSSKELTPNFATWYTDLQTPSTKSRRIVAVLSPSSLNGTWEPSNVHQALKQLQAFGSKLIVVALKDLPTRENDIKNSQGETLATLAKYLKVILWERTKDDKFWLQLRVRLPPKRRNNTVETESTQGDNTSRLTSGSRESLNSFV